MTTKNTRFRAGLLVALCGGLYAFQYYKVTPTPITLSEALAKKLVSCSYTSTGNYSGESVNLKLTNLSSNPLSVTIPNGTVFEPSDAGEQNLLLINDQVLAVNANGSNARVLDGFCMEASDHAPTGEKAMKLTTTKNTQLKELTAFMNKKGYDKHTTQSAVWAVSNGHSLSSIDNEQPKNKSLRAYLSKLTNQPDPWYAVPQERVVLPDRRIQSNPVSMTGKLEFESDGKMKVYEEVKTAAGEVKNTSKPVDFPMAGKWKYQFTITVKGWEKGDYVVNVMSDSKVVKSFPFTI